MRDILKNTVTNTTLNKKYLDICDMPKNNVYERYQDKVVCEECTPSHNVIEKAISTFGKDYRYEDSPNPVKELQNRKKDNTTLGRKCK